MLRLFKQYYPIRNAIFVLGEGLFIFLSVILASSFMLGNIDFHFQAIILKALLISITCQACLYYNDLYDLKITDTLVELGIRLLQALGASAIFLAIVYFIFPSFIISQGIFVVSLGFIIVFVISWRMAYTQILNRGLFNQKIIILGSSDTAKEIAKRIMEKTDSGYEIGALLSEYKRETVSNDKDTIGQESYDDISGLAQQKGIKKIVVALKEKRGAFPVEQLLKCRVNGIDVIEGNSFYEMLTGKLIVEQINPSWLIFSQGFQKTWSQKIVKRTTDIVLSILMLMVLSPFILLVAIIIKLDSKGPILFFSGAGGRKSQTLHGPQIPFHAQ